MGIKEYYTSTDCMCWKIQRRYSGFENLWKALTQDFPNFSLPSLPPKGVTTSSTKEEIAKRARALETFVQSIINTNVFNSNPSLMNFLGYGDTSREITVRTAAEIRG